MERSLLRLVLHAVASLAIDIGVAAVRTAIMARERGRLAVALHAIGRGAVRIAVAFGEGTAGGGSDDERREAESLEHRGRRGGLSGRSRRGRVGCGSEGGMECSREGTELVKGNAGRWKEFGMRGLQDESWCLRA